MDGVYSVCIYICMCIYIYICAMLTYYNIHVSINIDIIHAKCEKM